MKKFLHCLLTIALAASRLAAADLTGHKLLVTSVRTGDTEVFIADPVTGDLFNVSRSPKSEDRYPCWSPDKRPVWIIQPNGDDPTLIEPLRFQMAIDGSRATWRPLAR